jgi:hypothetical protein
MQGSISYFLEGQLAVGNVPEDANIVVSVVSPEAPIYNFNVQVSTT